MSIRRTVASTFTGAFLLLFLPGCSGMFEAVKFWHSESDRREDKRVKYASADKMEDMAVEISDKLAYCLPRSDVARDYFKEKGERMVLVPGEVYNNAEHTPDGRVQELMDEILSNLQGNTEFSQYFDIVIDRTVAEALRKRSEGPSETTFDDDESGIKQFPPNAIFSLRLTFSDENRRGHTSWNARVIASHLRSRKRLCDAPATAETTSAKASKPADEPDKETK